MIICIKSEMDSRPILYPLMRSLWNYGSILVITSNRYVQRLVDDVETNSFRNATIVVDTDGATDDIMSDYGYAPSDFDFVILDNMGVTSFDVLLIPVGAKQSEEFVDDINTLLDKEEHDKQFIIQFGRESASGKSKDTKRKDEHQTRRNRGKQEVDDIPEWYNPAAKFDDLAEGSKHSVKRITSVKAPFPTLQDIELVEAEHKFYEMPSQLVGLFYSAFGTVLGVDSMTFRKEMHRKDENRGRITAELNR